MRSILVDTSVWSLVLRKKELSKQESDLKDNLVSLIREGYVVMIGAIRQEILSGISRHEQFLALKQNLACFSDFDVVTKDYKTAADYFNQCRSHGIQGSHTDFLICSVAHNNNFSILTLDKDFLNYKKILDIDVIDLERLH
jgi:predicted nucleic acid-binding protein